MGDGVLLVLLLSSMAQVLVGEIQLEPESLTVLRGEEARLTCSTSAPWTVMVWLLNRASLLTISSEHGVLSSGNPNVMAEDRSGPRRASWTLVLRRVERHHQGQVTCDLQNVQTKTASLFVQERGTVEVLAGNWTVLRGQWVRFECHAVGWYPKPAVDWLVDGIEVSRGRYNVSGGVSLEGLFSLTSDLGLRAARSSRVECRASVSALPEPLSSGVRLTVVAEVVPEGDPCSALLLATAVLSSLLVLLLLSLCVVCSVLWSRGSRRTESSRGDSLWAIPPGLHRLDHAVSGCSSGQEAAGGKVNQGYAVESLPGAGCSETRSQTDSVSVHEVPDVVLSRGQNQPWVDLEEDGSKSVRRVTTV